MSRLRITVVAFLGLIVSATGMLAEDVATGRFTEIGHPVAGGVRLVADGGATTLVLDADFVAKSGPDLVLFLSPKPIGQLDNRNATQDALRVAPLANERGAQRYPLPAGTQAERFRSVILHSETFSKLWGGADLRSAGR